jgi:hypothetical protein
MQFLCLFYSEYMISTIRSKLTHALSCKVFPPDGRLTLKMHFPAPKRCRMCVKMGQTVRTVREENTNKTVSSVTATVMFHIKQRLAS